MVTFPKPRVPGQQLRTTEPSTEEEQDQGEEEIEEKEELLREIECGECEGGEESGPKHTTRSRVTSRDELKGSHNSGNRPELSRTIQNSKNFPGQRVVRQSEANEQPIVRLTTQSVSQTCCQLSITSSSIVLLPLPGEGQWQRPRPPIKSQTGQQGAPQQTCHLHCHYGSFSMLASGDNSPVVSDKPHTRGETAAPPGGRLWCSSLANPLPPLPGC